MAPKTFRNAVVVLVAVILGLVVIREVDPPVSSPADPGFDPSPSNLAAEAKASDVHPPDQVPAGYYPPAPSKAVAMTPEWRSYADTVDRICALSFNYAIAQKFRFEKHAESAGWSDAATEAGVVRIWPNEDLRIHKATARIGAPPAQPVLFRAWRDNVATRTGLFFDASDAAGSGNFDQEGRILDRILRLKKKSDELGQRFGLRICTSN
jgi:hypothetical protein